MSTTESNVQHWLIRFTSEGARHHHLQTLRTPPSPPPSYLYNSRFEAKGGSQRDITQFENWQKSYLVLLFKFGFIRFYHPVHGQCFSLLLKYLPLIVLGSAFLLVLLSLTMFAKSTPGFTFSFTFKNKIHKLKKSPSRLNLVVWTAF